MFSFSKTELPEVILVKLNPFIDSRGFFCETYRVEDFAKAGFPPFVQENHSKSVFGTIRGLHFQKEPAAIGKLVRCSKGVIFDVAVDVRKDSPSFGKWVARNLSEENFTMLYVPPGFAHGFCALTEEVEVIYKTTGYYSKEHDCGIRWNDPLINIEWPTLSKYILSEKDKSAPLLKDLRG